MEKIYSSVKKGVMLGVVCRKSDIKTRREDFGSEKEALQASSINFKEGESVPAHKHLKNVRETDITQEAVVVVEGRLEVTFYDLDDSIIKKTELKEGDCCVCYAGGHLFKAISKDVKIYEIKNGPYLGKEKDKTYIG